MNDLPPGSKLTRKLSLLLRLTMVSLCAATGAPSRAHNHEVHRDMTDVAYEIMIIVENGLNAQRLGEFVMAPPARVDAAEWKRFLEDVKKSRGQIRQLRTGLDLSKQPACSTAVIPPVGGNQWAQSKPLGSLRNPVSLKWFTGNDCGVEFGWKPSGIYADTNPGAAGGDTDYSGQILGFWAAEIDDHHEDTHVWIKPLSVLGIGAASAKADDLIDKGLALPFIPLFCLFDCIFDDCDDCDSDALDFADSINPGDELLGSIPGIGDISGDDWVGVWHHIGLQPGADSRYDNHPGLLMDNSGPSGNPDLFTIGMMAVLDTGGVSLNYDKSFGPKNYEISAGGDGHQDTKGRSRAEWQFPPLPHLIFEPVDNLAKYGYEEFKRTGKSNAKLLGWSLHALGDAVVPMHAAATSGWGHRPFEEAIKSNWGRVVYLTEDPSEEAMSKSLQREQARRILERAFRWRQLVLDWRRLHPDQPRNTPIRDLVTALAQETFDYSTQQQPSGWPFDPALSSLHLVDEAAAETFYRTISAIDKTRPLVENGVGAILAFLISAVE